jgi:GH3 auxin-responsive promoter
MTTPMTEISGHTPICEGEAPPRDRTATRPAEETPRLTRSPYPAALGSTVRRLAGLRVALWDHALRNARSVQEKTLASLLDHAKGTEFGRAHGFASLRSYEDFARCVPVGDYDSFSPLIDRMRAGEKNVVVPEFVRYFGNSSGSSNHGKSKFLPITDRQIRFQQRAGADTVMRYLRWSHDDEMLCGYTLGLFPPTTMRREGPVLVTSNPALMMTKMPLFTRPVYLPDQDVRVIANYDEKLSVIADRYIDHDVRAIAGTTCWFTLLFEKVLAAARARGRRAQTISEVWPNLRVLFGGGVSAAPYLPVIRQFVGRDDVVLVDTYNATEGGVYAASDFSGLPGLLCLPHRGTFFEFVPLEDRGTSSPKRVPLWAVQAGRPYSIVVTTPSGLYAYELGDIVRFTSVDPLRIEFMGRLSGCLSLTQELTTHVEIEGAVQHAAAQCHATTVEFGAAGDVAVDGTAKSRYLLFVEFQEGAAPEDLDAFGSAFDEGLCKLNRVYREHRGGDVALRAPRVVRLASGGSRLFLEEVTRGNVQGKFPRIIDETKKQLLWKRAASAR